MRESPPQRAILHVSADSPFASAVRNSVPSPPAGLFLCRQRKRRKKPPEGTSSEHTSLTPFPQNRDTAKTPYRSVAPPLQIETHRFDLRRTFRRNLQAATKGSCAVFRRIRTRTPSPTTKGAAAPIGFPGVYGGRRTGDWTGDTDCHSRYAHRLRNDGDGGSPAAAGMPSSTPSGHLPPGEGKLRRRDGDLWENCGCIPRRKGI